MSPGLLYLDSSALVKLIVPERETDGLVRRLGSREGPVSSAISRVEVLRAVRRLKDKRAEAQANEVLRRVALVRLDEAVLGRASELEPRELRSLDAIHLATALSLGDNLSVLLTYNRRLTAAAKSLGVAVESPN